jgi:hypothetical protein
MSLAQRATRALLGTWYGTYGKVLTEPDSLSHSGAILVDSPCGTDIEVRVSPSANLHWREVRDLIRQGGVALPFSPEERADGTPGVY